MDTVEEQLAAERLLEVVECTRPERVHRRLHVAVAGDEDDRDPDLPRGELSLEPEAAHARQADLQQETARPPTVQRFEERLGGGVRLDGEPHRRAELAERLACSLVVIHDEDPRLHAGSARGPDHRASGCRRCARLGRQRLRALVAGICASIEPVVGHTARHHRGGGVRRSIVKTTRGDAGQPAWCSP